MNIVFFAARSIHRHYFSRLARQLNEQEPSASVHAQVIWHKKLWLNPLWLTHLPDRATQTTELPRIVDDHLREKQNSRKGRRRSAAYWRSFRVIKRAEAHLLFAIYQQALAGSNATHLVLWNGLKFRQRIVMAAARSLGIRVLVMENGLLPGMTTLDRRGVNFLNSVPRDPAFFIARSGKSSLPSVSAGERPEDLPAHYIFIPFQVNTDSQVVLFSPWLNDMFALTDALLNAEKALGERMPCVVLKTHPACDQDYGELAQQLSTQSQKIQLRLTGDTQAMIAHADAVATINSTVGIEAIIANINTLVLGQAFYNLPGLTLSAQNQTELEQQLPRIAQFSPNPTVRQGFLHYLQHDYQIPGRWQEADDEHIQAACAHLLREVNPLG
ncbi:MAG: hypothetical protein LRY66_18145 [Saccharospirillaceae bacterium]|nr:hypothetical protein [Saccharospirillaceae bacterium]MCD8533222.1 hypothetical protein [Saccharospirillaceae bacterium]